MPQRLGVRSALLKGILLGQEHPKASQVAGAAAPVLAGVAGAVWEAQKTES